MRAIRMRGTFESSFEDQFTWLRTLDSQYRVGPKILEILKEIQEPLVVTLFAEIQYTFSQSWDNLLWNGIPKLKSDHDIVTIVPNA
jgi:hypothetical protein